MKSITVSFLVSEGKNPNSTCKNTVFKMICGQTTVAKQNIYLFKVIYIYKKKSYLGMELVVLGLVFLYEIMVIFSKFTFGLCFHSPKEIKLLLQLSLCKDLSLYSVCFGQGFYFIVSFAKPSLGFSKSTWCSLSQFWGCKLILAYTRQIIQTNFLFYLTTAKKPPPPLQVHWVIQKHHVFFLERIKGQHHQL